MIGLTGVRSPDRREETGGSLHVGCFSFKTSLVDCITGSFNVVAGIRWSSFSTPPLVCLQRYLRALYEEVIHWRRNLFQVPLGASGKAFVSELARLF